MKKLTAAIASLGLVATLAAPTAAVAETDRTAKILAGVATAFIVAKALEGRKSNNTTTASSARAGQLGSIEQSGVSGYDGRRVINGRIVPYGKTGPKAGRGYKKNPLPQACLRVVETSRGDRVAYGTRCLNRNFRHASKLPGSCETLVRTNRGYRSVYGARCLKRDGWKVRVR